MIKVTISGKEYLLKNSWDDITLKDFQEVYHIAIPVKLKSRWLALIGDKMSDYDKIIDTHREIVKVYPEYYGKIIELLSDIPHDVIKYIDWSLRDKLFNDYLLHIAMSTIAPAPLQKNEVIEWLKPYNATAFKFKDEQYNLPESLLYGGREIPCKDEKIISFAESSDIDIALDEWGEKGIDAMAGVCAVYLRKPGEEYSEQLTIERTELFKELPMSAVWEVFFCIVGLGKKCESVLVSFLGETMQSMTKQLESLV